MSKKAKKTRMGRPVKKVGRLEIRFNIALDKKRRQRYQECAENAGVDLSEWIRRVCDSAADTQLGEK